ncbi:MAG TPA: hypothetical protein PK419_05980 [Spirochaetota bacterium]|jgi:hypothetical protein|nr:hypothetical protein [Spirochaetota bacterium]HOH36106.1 hypothetical protein [Spirochaetota bacterium]HPY01735.1 hypothetical protein [Spirochaetota bacterium]HQA52384.1 hypothetical protein [Spirochaetota bacterium]
MAKLSQSILGSLTRLNSTVASLAKRAEKLDSIAKEEAKIRVTILKTKIAELEKAIRTKK